MGGVPTKACNMLAFAPLINIATTQKVELTLKTEYMCKEITIRFKSESGKNLFTFRILRPSGDCYGSTCGRDLDSILTIFSSGFGRLKCNWILVDVLINSCRTKQNFLLTCTISF